MLTKEQVFEIPKLIKKGMTNKEIAAELGVHPSTIIHWKQRLREAGHSVPKQPLGRRSILSD